MAEQLKLPRRIYERLLTEARAALPHECCGLLGGHGEDVTELFAASNQLASPNAFEIPPQELFDIFRELRARKLELVGIYHSHPAGDNAPSRRDRERAESAEAIAELRSLGVMPVMLTGDDRRAAQAIAKTVGIDNVHAEQLPADKQRVVGELATQHGLVGMVGDGINDAPALARADIGFAMGAAGTATALEAADVAIMDDDPRKLASFIRISRRTVAVLRQNIVLALGIKAVFLALAVMGDATLWMAIFADVGASLLVVFNGLRVMRVRA